MFFINHLLAQNWPCGDPATYNVNIPDQNNNVHITENSVAVHPKYPNIILSAHNHHDPAKVSAFISTNWGYNWYSPYNNGIFDDQSYCDPAAAIDLNGRLYVSYLGTGGAIKAAYSDNFGSNWSVITVFNTNAADKDHLHIDNSCNSLYKGRIYCAWTQSYNSIKISYSDNGVNWSTPITLSNADVPTGVNIATDNSGNIYVVWAKCDGFSWDCLGFTKSNNGGANWSSPSQIDLNYISSISGSGVGPSMTINMQDNTIFLVYSGYSGLQYYYDAFLKKSINGGLDWSNETIVNQNRTGHQTFPWISCDPMSGFLACIYYDTRYVDKHTYVSISTNSGSSWCDMQVSSARWEGGGYGTGSDYIGIEFNKGIVYPVWFDTRGDGGIRTYTYPYSVIQKDLTVHDITFSGNNSPIQSANTITAYNITINSGANVIFRTVNSIVLQPGFFTNDNCIFTAELFHCESGSDDLKGITQDNEVKSTDSKEKDNALPDEFSLSQNYPNPFNPTTLIKYSLKENSLVKIIIYDILGREVRRLLDEYAYAGHETVVWDGTNSHGIPVSSGIYLLKIIAGDFTDIKKMVLIR